MQERQVYQTQTAGSVIDVQAHKVLKNTYLLLSMTLAFSALCAFGAMRIGLSGIGSLLCFGIGFLMLWLVLPRTQNSISGIWTIFAITGFLGASLGPMLNSYLSLANGPSLIMQSLGGTAFVFLALSGVVLTTKKDFSFLAGFLIVGFLVVLASLVLLLGASFFGYYAPVAHVALSAAIMLLMSGFILFHTSQIINGGETNYISATASLFISILNLFTSMLHVLGFMDE